MSFPYDILPNGMLQPQSPITPLNPHRLPSIRHLLVETQTELLHTPGCVFKAASVQPTSTERNLRALVMALQKPWHGLQDENESTIHTTTANLNIRMEMDRIKLKKLGFVDLLREYCFQLEVGAMDDLLEFVEGLTSEVRAHL